MQQYQSIKINNDKCHIKRYQHICLAGTHVLYASALHLNTLLYASRSVGGRRLKEVTNIDPQRNQEQVSFKNHYI